LGSTIDGCSTFLVQNNGFSKLTQAEVVVGGDADGIANAIADAVRGMDADAEAATSAKGAAIGSVISFKKRSR
jgi:hypothetical protein